MKQAFVIGSLIALIAFPAVADTWAWPDQMILGGFTVSAIRGTVNPDGTGSATGSVELPGTLGQKVTLTRSTRGDVSGNVAVSLRMSGSETQGAFLLDAHGLEGKGVTVRLTPRSIVEAQGVISTSGLFAGSGRLALGNVGVPVKFSISRDSLQVYGLTNVQAQADTPLATYAFTGDLEVSAPNGRLSIVAAGVVRRSGKLSNQVSTANVSDVQVNPNDGTGVATIDGVNVTLAFFRP